MKIFFFPIAFGIEPVFNIVSDAVGDARETAGIVIAERKRDRG